MLFTSRDALMTTQKWKLQDAKARFSEVVRRAHTDGPQHITVHGKDSVVVVSLEDFTAEQTKSATGADLVAALSQLRGLDIVRESVRSPVRPDVTFD
jgi:antitoxin Phd